MSPHGLLHTATNGPNLPNTLFSNRSTTIALEKKSALFRSLTRHEEKPGRDELLDVDVSPSTGELQAESVALEQTMQFNS